MKIYVASSWRNLYFDDVFACISQNFPHVYNFKAPGGFHWKQVLGSDWEKVSLEEYKAGLEHPEAVSGFIKDEVALKTSKATVLILPCGRSAHLELGVAVGLEQFTAIYTPEPLEPELMYKFVDLITDDIEELIVGLQAYEIAIWNAPTVYKR